MTQLMKTVLILSLSGTLLAAGVALLRRALKNRLPHGLFYYLWLLVLLRLMVPVALPVPGLERVMEPPAVLGPNAARRDLPQAADYDLWIQADQKETFVRNWKAEYHDGTEVASVQFAPKDHSGNDYVFRGRDLPALRARVEAWAFAELPLDRDNCILYYQMEPELLLAASSQITVFPLDGGEPARMELSQLDMSTYCGHVTVTDLGDNGVWLVVLTDGGRAAQSQPTVPDVPDQTPITGPLTEEQQAPVMENIRAWAAENLKSDSEPRLTYSVYQDQPQGMGWAAMYANGCWLYDLHTGGIRAVDGTYADTAQLGMVLAQGAEDGKNRTWVFYLTNGEPADGADPILRLEQIAAEYPNGRVSRLTWWRQEDKGIYMTMHFLSDGKGYTCEYSSITGVADVLPDDRTPAGDVNLPLDGVPGLLANIFRWQTEQDTPHNGQNYSLDLSRERRLAEILVDTQSQVAVHDLATGEMTRLEGSYTGSLDYGCITVLGPAKSPFWLYIIDNTSAVN